ncbi:MAG: glycosyltransferase [Sporomusaceae bacterium]|nr:glycosyltransferase [Sporomusaceae bacterium]
MCILFHEKMPQTIECIKSFLSSGVNIYVLNNNSSESACRDLRLFCRNHPNIQIFESPSNLGVGVGRNALIQNTREPWLFFVDNDIRIYTADWLEVLQNHVVAYPEIEAFVPRLFNVHDKRYVPHLSMGVEDGHVKTHIAETAASNMFPGGAAIVSRRLFDRLGLYDREIKVGLEDWELALRALLSGNPVRTRSVEDILLVHDHRQVQDEETKKAVLTRYDEQIIEISYQRLIKKHGVSWDHDYRPWLREQLRLMVAPSAAESRFSLGGRSWKARRQPTSCYLHALNTEHPERGDCGEKFVGGRPADGMAKSIVARILELYPHLRTFHVMGEPDPLLFPRITELVDYVKSLHKTIGINTNGAYGDKLLSLRYEPDYISFRLYGWNAGSTLAACGSDIFTPMVQNYRQLKEKYNNLGFCYTVSKNNYQDLGKILDLCDDLQPTFLRIANYLPDDLRPEQVEKIITVNDRSIIGDIERVIGSRPYIVTPPSYLRFGRPSAGGRPICKSYKKVISIDAAGNVGGCIGPVLPRFCAGNIFSADDPNNTPEMRRLRNLAVNGLYPHPECLYCTNKLV